MSFFTQLHRIYVNLGFGTFLSKSGRWFRFIACERKISGCCCCLILIQFLSGCYICVITNLNLTNTVHVT